MKIRMDKIRQILVDNRVFLMGPNMNGPEDIASSYPDHMLVNIPADL